MALSASELNSLGCKDHGNIVSMDTLKTNGDVAQWTESFHCSGAYVFILFIIYNVKA